MTDCRNTHVCGHELPDGACYGETARRFPPVEIGAAGAMVLLAIALTCSAQVLPGATWEFKKPAEVGMDAAKLDAFRDYLGGRGCIVRHGYMVYTWGDQTQRQDVASALKPVIAHFLFKAVEEGKLASLDEPVLKWEPCLNHINPDLDFKDRLITFRHMATQTSCYGVQEKPGTAFDYNDWQITLFWDTLFLKIYGVTYDTVDAQVLHSRLTDPMQCEDNPTLMLFGTSNRPGRLGISVRDFARFGLLYLHKGNWNGKQLISSSLATLAVSSPLPNSIPRTSARPAQMCPGQRSIGSQKVPDDQTDHSGSYSYLWWVNGLDSKGQRFWPSAPADTYGAFGHANGQRAVVVIPSLDLVVSWNDTTLGDKRGNPRNEAFKILMESLSSTRIVADPEHPAWLKHQDGLPFYMCGPGDPEGFLYRGTRNPDGTRSGDQMALVNKLAGTGANCIYLMAIRSHGGDGDATHNPYVDSDLTKGLDEDILNQWETWFTAMDSNGIVIFFFFYDDSASPFGKELPAAGQLKPEEASFIDAMVGRFKHHRHLIWCVAEEYAEKLAPAHAAKIAERIRQQDDRQHPVSIHQNNGTSFDFKGNRAFDQFAVQWNVDTPAELHAGTVAAWKDVGGWTNLNMSEFADSSFGKKPFAGTGESLRRKIWAIGMGGGYSMILGMDIASTPIGDLQACGRLVRFMEATHFNRTSPRDDLARGDTDYVLAAPGQVYIAYGDSGGKLGLLVTAGSYRVRWFTPMSGDWVDEEDRDLGAGEQLFAKPAGFADEAVLYLEAVGGSETRSAGRERQSRRISLENGWFVHGDRIVWGYAQHCGWWRAGQRANIARRAPGAVGPNRTEDLDNLTDNMLRHGYPGFEHNFGLWYDRRRDQHDLARREDGNVVAPFLEQPWARGESGRAWDGLAKYDLTRYNAWYFDRLREFASLCDRKGTILFHNFYMQHALLETDAHYVDFPWRPANCLQQTDMPDKNPAANVFYDVTHPLRRELHRAYIRKCLDALGDSANVVHLLSQEYTGPTSFARFWLDVIGEWQQEKGKKVLVGLGGTKDVLDELAADPRVSVLDLRYWWYQPDGSLYAPKGGTQVPGRYVSGTAAARTTPSSLHRQVREYRMRYPGKALIHQVNASRQQTWAFLMGGGSMLIRYLEYAGGRDPANYEAPADSAIIQPTYDFINKQLSHRLPRMVPQDSMVSNPENSCCLADKGNAYLVYLMAGGTVELDLKAVSGEFKAQWFDPRNGMLHDAAPNPVVKEGRIVTFTAPTTDDWVLWLTST
jgi:hypothetical protein